MTKKNNCKICGDYSGKRKICQNCKIKYPFKSAGKGGNPFERNKEHLKAIEKEKRNKK